MPHLFSPALTRLWLALAVAALSANAGAADTTAPEPAPAAEPRAPAATLASVRAHIAGKRWSAAIADLKAMNASGDVDWNNLMGYALRKQAKPDLDGAQRHYETALRINPKHLGALAYSGELALMKGDLATAEARLAVLGGLCSSPCEALDELKQSIALYKPTNKR